MDRSAKPEGSNLSVDSLVERGVYIFAEETEDGSLIPVLSLFQLYEWSGKLLCQSVSRPMVRFARVLRAMISLEKRYTFEQLEHFHLCEWSRVDLLIAFNNFFFNCLAKCQFLTCIFYLS